MAVAIALVGILFLALLPSTYARDLGQWENSDPAVREWYRNLKRPDFPQYSCCGAADAYWCDEIHVKHGDTYCIITDDRDDEPLERRHIPVGTEIYIPPNKLKWDAGNPTGHSIVFLAANFSAVVCFVQNSGI
jgi:hypothetical protein